MPTLKTLAANAMVKDKIKYFEELSDKQVPTIRLDKIPVSQQDMRNEELKRARVSKYKKHSSFQNLFHERLEQMPQMHNEQFFKDHKVGALKLNTFFLDKQFQIKQRGNNTCMVDFVWHNCKGKKGFQKYTYQKLFDELEVYASASFPRMST